MFVQREMRYVLLLLFCGKMTTTKKENLQLSAHGLHQLGVSGEPTPRQQFSALEYKV